VAAHSRNRALPAAMLREAEPGSKKPAYDARGFTHHRVDRHHLRSPVGRNVNPLARGQYVELVGVQDELLEIADVHLSQKSRGSYRHLIHIDDAGELLRTIADELVGFHP